MTTYELREVEALLIRKHRIADDNIGAFRGWLRPWRCSGVTRVGYGKRYAYTKHDIWEMHVVLKLHDIGLPPRLIAEIIKSLRLPPQGKGSYVVIMFMDTCELRTIVLEKRSVGGSIDGWIQLGNPRDFMIIKLDDEIASYR